MGQTGGSMQHPHREGMGEAKATHPALTPLRRSPRTIRGRQHQHLLSTGRQGNRSQQVRLHVCPLEGMYWNSLRACWLFVGPCGLSCNS